MQSHVYKGFIYDFSEFVMFGDDCRVTRLGGEVKDRLLGWMRPAGFLNYLMMDVGINCASCSNHLFIHRQRLFTIVNFLL